MLNPALNLRSAQSKRRALPGKRSQQNVPCIDRGLPGDSCGKRICLPMQEMQVQSLGQDDPLEEEMATHSSILAWEISWTEEPGRLQSFSSVQFSHSVVSNSL